MNQLVASFKFLSLAFLPLQGRIKTLYQVLDESQSLCESKAYLNLGYWGFGATNMDAAGQDLVELMAQAAQLTSHDNVLDVGFGYADQDLYWQQKYQPKKITGLNISPDQVKAAKLRVQQKGLQQQIDLQQGDATQILFTDNSFDVVFALECAFHFRSREKFLYEAYRVLKPGGRLVMVDLIAVERKLALKDRLAELIGRSFWQIPKENMYEASVLNLKMQACGFAQINLTSIWQQVYPPYVDYARRRLCDQDVSARLNPVFKALLKLSLKARKKLSPEAMDYVLVVAKKP